MKFNKWTLGLATVGVVSLASAVTARADMNPVQSAANNLSISGAVDTSLEWGIRPSGNDFAGTPAAASSFRAGKQDGFNLNVVKLSIEKPMDESEWASGFKVDLLFGPDAVGYNATSAGLGGTGTAAGPSDVGIKQAYVALRTPVGNGINWKIGVFDTIIGYEVFESWLNPNFTRSWGYFMEPTEHTGFLANYQFNDMVSASVGLANTWSSGINARNTTGDTFEGSWNKTWMASIALTAPESWGSLAGSTLYAGIVSGFDAATGGLFAGAEHRVNYYLGAVIKTPVEGLTAGIALDRTQFDTGGPINDNDATAIALYASYKASEKLSFHARGEYAWVDISAAGGGVSDDAITLTGTIQYDLWANVISRLELRYDNAGNEFVTGGPLGDNEGWLFAANIVYTF